MTRPVDEPIIVPEQDELGRTPLSLEIAEAIREVDASNGMVLGVVGPWGSGKTSLLNLIEHELAKPQELNPALRVIKFNPWIFSGADQLVEHFFMELVSELRDAGDSRLVAVADSLQRYAQVLAPLSVLPIIGGWFGRAKGATDALSELLEQRRGGLSKQRNRLEDGLRSLEQPIVVVLDDIDRLQNGEIQEVFKLVRLTARFPNIVYVLAFDRTRVEQALSNFGMSGRDYLEKIVQVIYDLPTAPDLLFTEQVLRSLDLTLEGIPRQFDQTRWGDVLAEIIRPLLRTPRDSRRYAAAVRGTFGRLSGKVEGVDVLALEAVRLFLPDLFVAISKYRRVLTESVNGLLSERPSPTAPRPLAPIQPFLDTAGANRDVALALIRRLFPMASIHIENRHFGSEWQNRWIRERRVAHGAVLSFYLDQHAGETLRAFWMAEEAFELLANASMLSAFLSSLDPALRCETISSLEVFQDEYPTAAVVPASTVLMSFVGSLPDRTEDWYVMNGDDVIGRVILRLLRRFSEERDREQAVLEILETHPPIGQRELLLSLVGHEENLGHKEISEGLALQLEKKLFDDIHATPASQLACEQRLTRLLIWIKKASIRLNSDFAFPVYDREFARAVIRKAIALDRVQGSETRYVRRQSRFNVDLLVFLFDDKATVETLLRTCEPVDGDEILAQAVHMGWAALEKNNGSDNDNFDD